MPRKRGLLRGHFPVLLLIALASAAPAAGADPARRTSVQGRYLISLRPSHDPVRVNRWQEWRIHIDRSDRAPLALHEVAVDGGMPAHGHGLPTTPAVTAAGSPGVFAVRGVRFHMAGDWQLRVLVADGEGVDAAIFPVRVVNGGEGEAAAARVAWSETERAALRSLSIERLGPPPPDRSNRVADDPRAAAFGHRLFFDAGLSGTGRIACATCHQPRRHFTDRRARARGVSELDRNTPSVVGVGYSRWLYWDGRRDSSWSQALAPIEAADEMGGTRVGALRAIARRPDHVAAYEELFGPLPDLDGLPAQAGPHGGKKARAAWSSLAPARKAAIDRAFANLGKAIAAYERRLVPGVSAFDRYVEAVERGDSTGAARLLGPRAVSGLKLFISDDAQCMNCHNGPLFTNGEFHNIGTGVAARRGDRPDFGRSIGIQALLAAEFNCMAPTSDDAQRDCPELRFLSRHDHGGSSAGAYKVPGLRNAARSAPYMHDGRFATLAEAIGHYRRPGPAAVDFRPLFDMTPRDIEAVAAFLEALAAPVAAPPGFLDPPVPPPVPRRAAQAKRATSNAAGSPDPVAARQPAAASGSASSSGAGPSASRASAAVGSTPQTNVPF